MQMLRKEKVYNPILAGQISRGNRELFKFPKKLKLLKKLKKLKLKKKAKIHLSKRQDRPDAILRLCKMFELTDGQISKLVGSTKGTVSLIRKRVIGISQI